MSKRYWCYLRCMLLYSPGINKRLIDTQSKFSFCLHNLLFPTLSFNSLETYFGLPLGTTRPSLQDFTPLLTKFERRLTGISRFLSYQGRLILVNSVFSALPTFYMCSLQIPPLVIKQVDRYRKHCLWSGVDINRKGSFLAAWDIDCKSKKGGLGIIDMKNQNYTLLIKFLDKFYNHAEIPWVELTWSKLYRNTK